MRAPLALLALLLLLFASGARAGEDARSTAASHRRAADETLTALRAGRPDALAKIAADRELDPYLVVDALLGMRVERLPQATSSPDFAAAALAYAEAVGSRPEAEGLLAWLTRWNAWPEEAFEREARLRIQLAEALAALRADEFAKVIRIADETSTDRAHVPQSLTAMAIDLTAARALLLDDRLDEAAARSTDDAIPAEAPAWPLGRLDRAVTRVTAMSTGADPAVALEGAAQGRAAAQRLGRTAGVALFAERRAHVFYRLGRWSEALAEADAAAALALSSGEHRLAARALFEAGHALMMLGRITETVERARRGQTEAQAAGAREAFATLLVLEGAARADAGDPARGLELAERGVAELRALKGRTQLAGALDAVGHICWNTGLLERAEALYREALPLAQAEGDTTLESRLRTSIATLATDSGRYAEAEAQLAAARPLVEASGSARRLMWLLLQVGKLEARRTPGEAGLVALEAALAHAETLGEPRPLALVLVGLAEAESRRALWVRARQHVDRALALASQVERRPDWLGTGLQILAFIEYAARRLPEALEALHQALEFESVPAQGLGPAEASGVRARTRVLSDHAFGIAVELARGSGPHHDLGCSEAFAFAEAGRAGVLLRDLLQRDALLAARLPPELVAEEERTRERVATVRGQLLGLAHASPPDAASLRAAQGRLQAALSDREHVLNRVERRARLGMHVAEPRPVTLERMRAALPEGTVLVLYQIRDPWLYVLVVTAGCVETVMLGEWRSIAEDAEAWLALISAPGGPEEELAAQMHRWLIARIGHALVGQRRLVIAPDGVLAFLPFAALLDVQESSRRRLVEDFEIVCIPSGSLFVHLQQQLGGAAPGRGLVALGDPDYGTTRRERGERSAPGSKPAGPVVLPAGGSGGTLPSLPGTRVEVERIAALFPPEQRTLLLGAEATRARFTEVVAGAPGRLRALHLACHAVVDPAHPRQSGLVVSGAELFTLADVAVQRFDADLVTLSACSTARGRLLHGEGVLGLAYGFFLAGAPRVLASNWRVEDASARDLIVRVYEGWMRDGLGVAGALRRAQRERLAAGGPLAHPYHWAAFSLWGLP